MAKIAFLGLGQIGAPMATRHLRTLGYECVQFVASAKPPMFYSAATLLNNTPPRAPRLGYPRCVTFRSTRDRSLGAKDLEHIPPRVNTGRPEPRCASS
jgi:hypothetical protein